MERRSRGDPKPSFTNLFLLGVSAGIVASILVTVFELYNPLIGVLNLKSRTHPLDDQSAIIEKALDLVANNQLTTSSMLPTQLLLKAEEVLARLMAQEVRVLCMVMINTTKQSTEATHLKNTWGRHCNKLIFMSDENLKNDTLHIVDTKDESHRSGSWAKTIESYTYVWKKMKDKFDWVIKVDDTNLVFVENLQRMLLPYSSEEAIYFGFRMNPILRQGYMGENAGIVMSNAALKGLMEKAFEGKHKECPPWTETKYPDDVQLGQCLKAIGAVPGDSRDWEGRHRFFPLDVAAHTNIVPPKYEWFWKYTFWPAGYGLESCSETPVSFHYIKPTFMYIIEYLAFQARPFIVNHLDVNTPTPTDATPSTLAMNITTTGTTTTTTKKP